MFSMAGRVSTKNEKVWVYCTRMGVNTAYYLLPTPHRILFVINENLSTIIVNSAVWTDNGLLEATPLTILLFSCVLIRNKRF